MTRFFFRALILRSRHLANQKRGTGALLRALATLPSESTRHVSCTISNVFWKGRSQTCWHSLPQVWCVYAENEKLQVRHNIAPTHIMLQMSLNPVGASPVGLSLQKLSTTPFSGHSVAPAFDDTWQRYKGPGCRVGLLLVDAFGTNPDHLQWIPDLILGTYRPRLTLSTALHFRASDHGWLHSRGSTSTVSPGDCATTDWHCYHKKFMDLPPPIPPAQEVWTHDLQGHTNHPTGPLITGPSCDRNYTESCHVLQVPCSGITGSKGCMGCGSFTPGATWQSWGPKLGSKWSPE